jgi:hypothetical protein
MVLAAGTGRGLDGGALLPGVAESAAVRGAAPAWLVALTGAALLGAGSATVWRRTQSLRALVPWVIGGQVLVFLAGEAAGRIVRGDPPLDPDGLLGAALQAVLALALLTVLALGWAVLRAAAPVPVRLRSPRLTAPDGRVVPLPKNAQRDRPARAPPGSRSSCAA